MKTSSFIFLAILSLTSIGQTGGISDGGGGTTNPIPSRVSDINYVLSDWAPLVIAWFYKQEQQYRQLDNSNKPQSSVHKIFSTVNYLEVIKSIQIEVRQTSPCYDRNSNPAEGSVLNPADQTICMSPYLIHKKLNVHNYDSETLALLIHEISHIFGTSEDEAIAIQSEAVNDFYQLNLWDTLIDIKSIAGSSRNASSFSLKFSYEFLYTEDWVPSHKLRSLATQLLDYKNEHFDKNFSGIMIVPDKILSLYYPHTLKLTLLDKYICSQKEQTEELRKICQAVIDNLFKNKKSMSLRDALLITQQYDYGPAFEQITISEFNHESFRQGMIEIRSYLEQIRRSVVELSNFKFKIKYM